ncbi:MAG TPA: hypothetical protein VFZ83_08295 [Acidimicrobiia bacterium]|nr:hypothetical protein [Acidimicrobiia bacterium]
MVISERARHELFVKLEQILGREEATTLMEHLPPVGWADVATKRDLDALEERMDLRFASVEHRIELLRAEFRAELAEGQGALRHELFGAFGEFRAELAEGQGALRHELFGAFGEFRAELAEGHAALRVDVADRIGDAVRTMVLAFVSSVIAATALGFGAARLA